MSNALKYILYCAFVWVLNSCKPRVPRYILSEKTMENVLYDYYLAKVMSEAQTNDSLSKNEYLKAVFQKYNVTTEEFDASLKWYTRHTEILYDVYKRLNIRFGDMEKILGNASSRGSLQSFTDRNKDTVNIWNGRNFYILSNAEGENRLSFSISLLEDSTCRPGDRYSFQWKMRYLKNISGGNREMDVCLVVTYENDSVFSRYERVWGDGQSRLNITTSDLLSVKNISGFIYLKETKETPLTYLFIEEPLLFRFKAKQKDVSNIVQEEDSVIKTRQNDSLMEIPAKVENGIIVRKRSTHRPISRQ